MVADTPNLEVMERRLGNFSVKLSETCHVRPVLGEMSGSARPLPAVSAV